MNNEIDQAIKEFTKEVNLLANEISKTGNTKLATILPLLRSTTLKVAPLYSETNPTKQIDTIILVNFVLKDKLHIATDSFDACKVLNEFKLELYSICSKVFCFPKNISAFFPAYAAYVDLNTLTGKIIELLNRSNRIS